MTSYISMAGFALAASISPGPVNIVALSTGAKFGLRASLRHVSGATVGFSALLLLIGLGLQTVLIQYPMLTTILSWAGVTFLLYMAYQLAIDGGNIDDAKEQRRPSMRTGAAMQ